MDKLNWLKKCQAQSVQDIILSYCSGNINLNNAFSEISRVSGAGEVCDIIATLFAAYPAWTRQLDALSRLFDCQHLEPGRPDADVNTLVDQTEQPGQQTETV